MTYMTEGNYAPIIVSVYDRLEHLKRCVKALLDNELAAESVLYIVSDAAYKPEHQSRIIEVREYASSVSGFKEVRLLFRKENLGAHESIRLAIEEVLFAYDTFIFLEDDIVVARDFLSYMNEGLAYYKDAGNIFAVCGFSLPFPLPKDYDEDIYFYPCNSPWGFATWKDRWNKVNLDYFDREAELKKERGSYKAFASIGFFIKGILQADSRGVIKAMDLRVYYHMFQRGLCSVFPTVSKTQNWGFDGTGEHCGENKNSWWVKPKLDSRDQPIQFIPFNGYNEELLKNHRVFQDKINGGFLARWLKYTWVHDLWKRLKGVKFN